MLQGKGNLNNIHRDIKRNLFAVGYVRTAKREEEEGGGQKRRRRGGERLLLFHLNLAALTIRNMELALSSGVSLAKKP